MKYYIIAGEASGDLHAANLIRAIKSNDAQAAFRVWGGKRMQAEGATLVRHYRDLAFMGFIEVIFNLKTILRNIAFCKKDILSFRPDVLILVDYPGFNLRIAEFAKQQGLKVVYYISPQVWAWKKSRVHKIKKTVDKMLVILPFEQAFYAQYNYEVTFVGHPLLDALKNEKSIDRPAFLNDHKLVDQPIIALLPGSRQQEVEKMLRVMLEMVPLFPEYQFVVAAVGTLSLSFYQQIIARSKVSLLVDQTMSLLQHATAAVVTSGTATLETALMGVPEVVCYSGNRISYEIAKRVIHIKYISLVNLIMDKEVVKELIQDTLNKQNLQKELHLLLNDRPTIDRIKSDYISLKEKLGSEGASARAADQIRNLLT